MMRGRDYSPWYSGTAISPGAERRIECRHGGFEPDTRLDRPRQLS